MSFRSYVTVLVVAFLIPSVRARGQHVEHRDVEIIKSTAKVAPNADVPDISKSVPRIIEMTNQFRMQQGLPGVKVNSRLAETASYFANFMAKHDRYGHQADHKRPAERAKNHDYDYCVIAENIAYQFNSQGFTTRELAQKFFRGWKNSPPHRKNMLDAGVVETGVAVARSEKTGYFYAVQMFGRPRSMSIEFQITNQSNSNVDYKIGEASFSLPPRYTRTHERCRPGDIHFQWSEKNAGPEMPTTNGAEYIITQNAAGTLEVNRKQAKRLHK